MTNRYWDVIFMHSNDNEGMTDGEGVEWLMMNDEEQDLSYRYFVTREEWLVSSDL